MVHGDLRSKHMEIEANRAQELKNLLAADVS
jgi:hypothetical protein